jgi:signal transduction histidine kinase
LHGILASTEFLRDSILDNSQAELVSTIQSCSGTLLDTINHVLDYSKINSFETSGDKQGPVANELYQVTNLALLCEDVIEGMVAANSFRANDASLVHSTISGLNQSEPQGSNWSEQRQQLEIVVDIENRDWDFRVEAGKSACEIRGNWLMFKGPFVA